MPARVAAAPTERPSSFSMLNASRCGRGSDRSASANAYPSGSDSAAASGSSLHENLPRSLTLAMRMVGGAVTGDCEEPALQRPCGIVGVAGAVQMDERVLIHVGEVGRVGEP